MQSWCAGWRVPCAVLSKPSLDTKLGALGEMVLRSWRTGRLGGLTTGRAAQLRLQQLLSVSKRLWPWGDAPGPEFLCQAQANC